ncbi:hypothetical protein LEP1GSC196_2990 [Leptospira meyeri serovar Semaranga str. Veldrot Semarang 173]|nr:hypothetical protein LEP1GSC196_2990 [Leptospira meyeri serovar Semaranga str. Veldrot Semarang 173]
MIWKVLADSPETKRVGGISRKIKTGKLFRPEIASGRRVSIGKINSSNEFLRPTDRSEIKIYRGGTSCTVLTPVTK